MRYIGLDIGDGESAATLVLEHGAMTQQVLTLGSAESILSVVGMLDGEPVVGSEALTGAFVTERSARFKSRFLTDEDPEDLRRFARGLYKLMNQTAQHALSGDSSDVRLALGRPAGWDENACRRYAQIVADAGFPNVYTVSESRAAFLYVHYDKDLQISTQNLQKPCLVIDIGSSTTDFAYIVDGRESNVGVFGQNHLGGGLIDRLIVEDAVAACSSDDRKRLTAIFAKEPAWYSDCELFARKKKETYFKQEAMGLTEDVGGSVGVHDDIGHPVFLKISLNKEKMDRLLRTPLEELGGVSFLQGLTDALQQAKKFAAAPAPEWLILTGGASRMLVFQEACKAAFPNAEVLVCPQPEFSIARGLGVAARIDHQVSLLRGDLSEFFQSDTLQKDVTKNIGTLKTDFVPQLADVVLQEGIIPSLQLAAQDGIQSQEEFLDNVDAYIRAYLKDEEHTEPLRATVQNWVSQSLTETQTLINDMCAKYDVDPAELKLSALPIRLDLGHLQLPWLFPTLINVMGTAPWPGFRAKMADVLGWLFKNNHNRAVLQNRIRQELMQDGNLANMLCQHLTDELRENLSRHVQEAEIMLR